MVELDALFTLAELAITMIGVAGLVAVFLSKGGLKAADRFRFTGILVLGINAALLAYIPYWASKYVSSVESIWRFSSIFALVWIVPSLLIVSFLLAKDALEDIGTVMSGPIKIAGALFAPTTIAVFLMNALSWPVNSNSTLYELAVLLMLGSMTFQFGSLVMHRPLTPSVSPGE